MCVDYRWFRSRKRGPRDTTPKAAVEDEKRSAAISEENALRAIGVKGYPSSIDDRRSGGERDVGEKGRFY